MGSFVTGPDEFDSVHKQNPVNARPVAASNILLENVPKSLSVLAETGMLCTLTY
jgi:hypothetical protein